MVLIRGAILWLRVILVLREGRYVFIFDKIEFVRCSNISLMKISIDYFLFYL